MTTVVSLLIEELSSFWRIQCERLASWTSQASSLLFIGCRSYNATFPSAWTVNKTLQDWLFRNTDSDIGKILTQDALYSLQWFHLDNWGHVVVGCTCAQCSKKVLYIQKVSQHWSQWSTDWTMTRGTCCVAGQSSAELKDLSVSPRCRLCHIECDNGRLLLQWMTSSSPY